MAKYQTRVEQVEAAKLDTATDYTNTDGTVVPAGHYLIRHADGHISALSATDFEAQFEASVVATAPTNPTDPNTPVEAPQQ